MIKISAKPVDPKRWKNNLFKRYGDNAEKVHRQTMGKAAGIIEAEVKTAVRRKMPGAGELIQSYQIRGKLVGGRKLDLRVTSLLPYARIQDLGTRILPGGKIVPKTTPKRKALAIPLHKRLRKGGVWPRNYPSGGGGMFKGNVGKSLASGSYNSRLRIGPTSRRGNRLLVDASTGEPQFVLVKSVKFRGKQYIASALRVAKPRLRKLWKAAPRVAIGKIRSRA